jgi:hypothetical protein
MPGHLIEARAAHADVLHAGTLEEYDDDGSDDFGNFNDEKDALGVTDEQRALLESLETARRDEAPRLLMASKRQAL